MSKHKVVIIGGGFAGMAATDRGARPSEGRIAAMASTLVHRGPDAAGLWSSADGRVCLGHRRLAIIDLARDAV